MSETPSSDESGAAEGRADEGRADLARNRWGRVAANGDVYVSSGSGERLVGNWQAGDAIDGLALYSRRFDDLEAEVRVLEGRVRSSAAKPGDLRREHARLTSEVGTAAAIGDLDSLAARLAELAPRLDEVETKAREQRQAERAEAAESRKLIITEAKAVLQRGNFKRGTQEMSDLMDRWKALPRGDKSTDDALWKQLSATRSAFAKARKAHFAEMATQHAAAAASKKRLIEEATELAESTDWAETSRAYRDLMQRWKAAGSAGKAQDDKLWARFRAAQDGFFRARDAADSERTAAEEANLQVKETLLAEAEAILPVTDLSAAKKALRDIQSRWEAVGHIPRAAMRQVENRMKTVERAVADAERAEWRRTDPETARRASSTAEQLRRSITELETTLQRARESGDARAVAEATAALDARRSWLEQTEKLLS